MIAAAPSTTGRQALRRSRLVPAAIVLAWLAGCDSKPALMLYCGAGIRPPVAEAVEEFARLHGVRVESAYAGSEVLLGQMKLSGRGDLYMPGDSYYVEQAEQAGLIASTRPVCCLVPVILVQKGNPKRPHAARPGAARSGGGPGRGRSLRGGAAIVEDLCQEPHLGGGNQPPRGEPR